MESLRARSIVLENKVKNRERDMDSLTLQLDEARERANENEKLWLRREATLEAELASARSDLSEAIEEAAESRFQLHELLQGTTDTESALRSEVETLTLLLKRRDATTKRRETVDTDRRAVENQQRDELFKRVSDLEVKLSAAHLQVSEKDQALIESERRAADLESKVEDLELRLVEIAATAAAQGAQPPALPEAQPQHHTPFAFEERVVVIDLPEDASEQLVRDMFAQLGIAALFVTLLAAARRAVVGVSSAAERDKAVGSELFSGRIFASSALAPPRPEAPVATPDGPDSIRIVWKAEHTARYSIAYKHLRTGEWYKANAGRAGGQFKFSKAYLGLGESYSFKIQANSEEGFCSEWSQEIEVRMD